MIQIIFAIQPLFISSMLLGIIFVISMNMQKVTATTTNTHTMNVIGAPNQSAAAATGNNIEMTNSALAKKLNVVTSVSPITNIVKNVGGEKIELSGLVPEGVNSHTFELVPSDVVKVNDADLVIIDGLGLETNVENVVDEAYNTKPNLQILKLGDNTITPDQYIFDFSFPEETGDPNPHLWLNVAYAMKFANLTRDKLMDIDPANADYYGENTDRYITKLNDLD